MSKLQAKHIEIAGVGYALYGSPEAPSYQMTQAPLYENRFAQGDRSFGDFKDWWYWAQDLFETIVPDEVWNDDGRFAWGFGIDTKRFPGRVGPGVDRGTERTLSSVDFEAYAAESQSSNNHLLFGRNVTAEKMSIRNYILTSVWEDTVTGSTEAINCAVGRPGDVTAVYFGCATVGSGASTLKKITGASTVADLGTETSAIKSMADGQNGFVYYLRADKKIRSLNVVSEAQADVVDLPVGSDTGDWRLNYAGYGDLYFAVVGGWIYTVDNRNQLWGYDITNAAWTMIRKFKDVRSIQSFSGKLYILDLKGFRAVLLSWDGSTLTAVKDFGSGTTGFQRADLSLQTSSQGIDRSRMSAVGDYLYIPIDVKDIVAGGSNTSVFKPVGWTWVDGTGGSFMQLLLRMDMSENIDPYWDITNALEPVQDYQKIFVVGAPTGTGGHRFMGVRQFDASDTKLYENSTAAVDTSYPTILTSFFDGNLPNVTKHWEDLLINSGDWLAGNFDVSYRTHENEAFTTLPGSEFYSTYKWCKTKIKVSSKKIQLKIQIPFGTSSGKQVFVSMDSFMARFLPKPVFLRQWSVRLLCADNIQMPDGSMEEKRGEELKSYLEGLYTKGEPVNFKDYNYADSVLNGAIAKTQPSTITSGSETSGSDIVIAVVASTGFLEGGLMKITDGDLTEWCLISDVTANNITVKRLKNDHGAGKTVMFDSIKVDNANEFPYSGVAKVGNDGGAGQWFIEYIHYMETGTNFISKLTRGYRDTVPRAHADDVEVDTLTQIVVKSIDMQLATTGSKEKQEFIANVKLVETI